MNFWRRLLGRFGASEPERPGMKRIGTLPKTPPPDAQRLGDTLMMGFTVEGRQYVIMDLDSFDYHYNEQLRQLPDPAQRDLDSLLPRVTRVRVRAGGMLRGDALAWPVLVDTSEVEAIAALPACLAIREDPKQFVHCSCLGSPTLELFSGEDLVATLSIHHGHGIRWARWRHDAPLGSGAINEWLVCNGIDRALLAILYENPFAMATTPAEDVTEPLSPAKQRLFLAQILSGRGALAEAQAVCSELIVGDPTSTAPYTARASIRKRMGDLDGALADLSSALERGGPDVTLLFERGVVLDQLGRPEEAIAELNQALQLDPTHVNALNSRGIVRTMLGELEGAKSDLDEAVRLAPEWELPYVHRAQVEILRGDETAAREDYNVAIEKLTALGRPAQRPMLAALHWNRGQLLDTLGETANAEADRQSALRIDPSRALRVPER